VRERRGGYVALIGNGKGRQNYLGDFKTLDEALAARKAAELRQYGELLPRGATP